MNMIIFSEFVSSNNFYLLLLRSLHLFIPNKGLGIYLQGIPTSVAADFFWGTNAGIRTLPLLSFLTLLQKIFGTNWDTAFLIISIVLPFLGFILSCRLLGKITIFHIIAAIFYGANLWITTRIYSGFWQLNIVYAFLPFLIAVPIKIAKQKLYEKINLFFFSGLYALVASIVTISQPHFLIITSIFSVLHISSFLIYKKYQILKRLVIFYSVAAFLFLILNAYFLVPSILYPEMYFTAPNQYFSLGSVLFNGSGDLIQNILRFDPLGFSTQEIKWTWLEYLQLVPILFFSILFFINKKRNYIFFSLVLLFIFLAKGINRPALMLSKWIYQNIFFMHYFRDPARFMSGVSLFAAFCISEFTLRKKLKVITKLFTLVITVIVFIMINSNLLKSPKIDLLDKTSIPHSYISMQQYINNHLSNDTNNRLLILPNIHGIMGYSWYTDKNPSTSNTIYDDILPLSIPLADSTHFADTPSNQVSSYLYTLFTKNYDSRVLLPLGVKYIIVDSSITKPDSEREIAIRSKAKLLGDKRSYDMIYENNNLSLFKVKSITSTVSENEPIYAIGNLETIAKNYASESARPMILLNQYPNSQKFDSINKDYFTNKQFYTDFKTPEIALASEILSKQFSVDILKAGWDYDKIFVNYEPYKMEYISKTGELFTSGRAVASRNLQGSMIIPHVLDKGKYHLLIKPLTTDKSSLTISIGGLSKNLDLNTNEKLIWIDEGIIINNNSKTKSITLTKNDNNFIAIDQLVLVPESTFINKLKEVLLTLNKMKQMNNFQMGKSIPIKSSVDPDKVSVDKTVKDITYRASYGSYWEANKNAEKFMSDGYGMTFTSNESNIKEINYFPDRIYKLSIVISLISGILAIIFLITYVRRNKRLLFD